MTEEWRAVTGFEGCYEVSGFGRVRSIRRKGSHALGVVLRGGINPVTGYRHVTLQSGQRHMSKRMSRRLGKVEIARLWLQAWLEGR